MLSRASVLIAATAAAVSAADIQCPIVLDGRVASSKVLTDFDSSTTSPFNPDYVKGNDLKWSDILLFPDVPNSPFDSADYKSLEVTISDKSIFQTQNGFRRAGLQFLNDTNAASPGYTGVKTLHWSVLQDNERPLNLTHEYLNVWHEAGDYSADQIMFQTGTIIGQSSLASDTFKILDRSSKLLWSTEINTSDWQNFAVTLDIDANTVQIYYSLGSEPLAAVTEVIAADLSGEGQFQLGMIKKPTGTTDVVNAGYQETGLNEGQIYGGLFVEDSTDGCISL